MKRTSKMYLDSSEMRSIATLSQWIVLYQKHLLIKRPTDKNAISKIAFWAWLIWPWKVKGQRLIFEPTCANWGVQAQFFFFAFRRSWWATSVKKNDLWPVTFQGQISQAQNAILEIAFFSAGVLLYYIL